MLRKTPVDLEQARLLYENGLSLRKVGQQLGTSAPQLSILLRRHGVAMRSNGRGNYPASLTGRIVELRNEHGQTWRQIAEAVGMSPAGARDRYLTSIGWRRGDPTPTTRPPKPKPAPVERRPPITTDQIATLRGWGATNKQIAAMLSITPATVASRLYRQRHRTDQEGTAPSRVRGRSKFHE